MDIKKYKREFPSRNNYADCLKALTIFCVVWGHTVSVLIGECFEPLTNYLNLYFCTFHMPMFMLISGYFAFFSEKKYTLKKFCQHKCKTILLPLVLWGTALFFVSTLVRFISKQEISFPQLLNNYIDCIINGFWYLTALFISSILLITINTYIKNNIVRFAVYLTVILLSHLISVPAYTAFMFPFYCLGYLINQYNILEIYEKLKKILKIILSLTICAITVAFCSIYTTYNTVYVSGTNIFNGVIEENITAYIIRFSTGVFSCATIYIITKYIYKIVGNKLSVIAYVGRYTMQIYIIHLTVKSS